ncbi:MAG: adenylate/guanylate cyclase domain-containing protein [Myxococcota bacterium]|nr:adenylate/guanylate cyclase domain-containing protein [Myxococcota bacterium]
MEERESAVVEPPTRGGLGLLSEEIPADFSEADDALKTAFLEIEAQQMRGAWALLAPIICMAILVTEILPYVSDEFPKDPVMSGMVIVFVSSSWVLARRGLGRRGLGTLIVVLAVGTSAYIGTACAMTGGPRSLHTLAIAVVIAVMPALGAFSPREATSAMVLSVAAWLAVVLGSGEGWGLNTDGLMPSLLYLVVMGTVSLGAVTRSRRIRLVQLATARRAEALHRYAVEEVLHRHLPPSYVEEVLKGKQVLGDAPVRQEVTILFADIVGFSELTERLEAEELTDLMAVYYDLAAQIGFEHGGTIDKFIGDAVMMLFGNPQKMDPAEQAHAAIQTGLALQKAAAGLRAGPEQREVRLRIGIHQDLVMVGAFGGSLRVDYTVLGRGVNVAARIEGACKPGEVLVSESVQDRLVPSVRDKGEARGLLELRGVERPIQAWAYKNE